MASFGDGPIVARAELRTNLEGELGTAAGRASPVARVTKSVHALALGVTLAA
ncbi:hypothetical protein DB30_07008 [Enhygromyxa salina]|uniref:Uncharacterized protein n=1 Tax=Enhygromyxa salina TaxID=215803 RepID=A0A0C1Z9L4_9BACT|nr:hypothetical protein DB30_07008 [Enhygromyxa salina]